jgi:hypothetical protein
MFTTVICLLVIGGTCLTFKYLATIKAAEISDKHVFDNFWITCDENRSGAFIVTVKRGEKNIS